jgi:hypothetical protein
MSGQQGYIYQANNRLIDAAIAAAISASVKTPLVYPVTKAGNGSLRVQGNYSGAVDAAYDVKVLDTALEEPVVSAPVFRGAGTGTISDIAVSGLLAQKVRVLCTSIGVSTVKAEIEIEGLKFRAKAEGAAGNAISIVVDESELVYTDSGYSTIKNMDVGETALEGQEWDWDTKTLLGGEIVPDSAHRVSFGADQLHIYRQYKKFESGVYKYFFITPIKYAVKTGTKVYFVSGGRTLTVSDGVTDEVYEDIITIADFWSAVKDISDLIEPVDSTINTSKTIDSPAVREIIAKTEAYNLPPYAASGSGVAGDLLNITPNDDTNTELILAKCVDNSYIGREIWDISGSSSGYLGQAQTGDYNEYGPIGFTVPQKLPDNWGQVNEHWPHEISLVERAAGVTVPPICFKMRLGINSQPQSLVLKYKKRPPNCTCPPVAFSDFYLGFQEEGGEIMAYIVPDLEQWAKADRDIMSELFYEVTTLVEPRTWIALTNFQVKTFCKPTTSNGYWYENVGLAGTSAATETSAWPIIPGERVMDGASIIWECRTPFANIAETLEGTRSARAAYQDFRQSTEPYFQYFIAAARRIMALPEDNPTLLEAMVTDFKAMVNSLNITYVETSTIKNSTWNGSAWTNNPSGTLEKIEIVDIKFNTTYYGALWDDILDYEKTYGVKKNIISVSDDGSYQTPDTEYYWEVKGSKAYQPALPDMLYYSTIKSINSACGCESTIEERYINTKEFAFLISIPCGGALVEGDTINVEIGGVAVSKTYQVGDITYLPTVAAQALQFAGGIDGNDTYIFSVRGDLDTFPDYLLDRDSPLPYSDPNISFTITDGIIMFAAGDVFDFNIEGGHWVWRKDGGDWSAAIDILGTWQNMDAGLQVIFDFGVSPSFALNDQWEILAVQENKASNFLLPMFTKYKGDGNITFTFSSPVTIDALIIDEHTLSAAITFQASDDADFDPLIHTEVITVADLIVKLFSSPLTAKYFRIVPASGTHEIGHIFLGAAMRLSLDSDGLKPVRRYKIDRQPAARPFSLLKQLKRGFKVDYSSFIYNADWELLDDMIDYLKTNNDMPCYFIPNINYPGDCLRVIIDGDNIEPGSVIDYNAPEEARKYTLSLPLISV